MHKLPVDTPALHGKHKRTYTYLELLLDNQRGAHLCCCNVVRAEAIGESDVLLGLLLCGTSQDTLNRLPQKKAASIHGRKNGGGVIAACPSPSAQKHIPSFKTIRYVQKNRKHFFVLSWTGFYHVFRVSWLLALRLRLVVAFNEMLRSDVCLPLLLLPFLTWGGNKLRLFCHTNLEPLNEAWGELLPAVGG